MTIASLRPYSVWFAVMIAAALGGAVQAKIVYVSVSGDDANDGLSWASAKASVQSGLDLATSGDQVWVAAGSYSGTAYVGRGVELYGGFTGTETALAERDWRANRTILDLGTNADSVAVSYSAPLSTRIDGFTVRNADYDSIVCDGTAATIANNTIIGGRGCAIRGKGAFLVALNNRIVGNQATLTYGGAGIHCENAVVTIANNVIACNSSTPFEGGGIYCGNTIGHIVNNTIVGNGDLGVQPEAGIVCSNSPLTIANNIIAFNRAGVIGRGANNSLVLKNNCVYGNALAGYQGVADPTGTNGNIAADPRLVDLAYGNLHIQPDSPCRDVGDNAAVQAGWVDADGQTRAQGLVDIGADESDGTSWSAGPYAIIRVSTEGDDAGDGSSWSLAKRTLREAISAASDSGGEVWVRGGLFAEKVTLAPYAHLYGGFGGTETAKAQRNWAAHRTILDGGQAGTVVTVRPGEQVSTLDGFIIRNGKSTGSSVGGGISCSSGSPTIANCRITGNTAAFRGGGAEFLFSSAVIVNCTIDGNSAGGMGGGIACVGSLIHVVNSTIVQNNGGSDGSDAFGAGGIGVDGSDVTVSNTLVAFNSSGVSTTYTGTLHLRHNCVYGNGAYDYSGVGDPTGTEGNISADPKLVDTVYGNLHIQPDSPCKDAGDDALVRAGWFDMDGQQRVQHEGVDIGADETDGTGWSAGPYTTVRVSPEGDDANDGASWSSAKRSVQAAVLAASELGGDVWVKAGRYLERITLAPYAHVYGGFSGAEPALQERDWTEHVTTLDGQQQGSVVTATTGFRVSRIDGFAITNGKPLSHGGGIYCVSSSPTVMNNRVFGNTAGEYGTGWGGGIYARGSAPCIRDNIIVDNRSPSGYGGGVCLSECFGETRGNVVSGNTADETGGGVWCSECSGRISNNTIEGNTARTSGGGIFYSASSSGYHLPPLVISGNVVACNTASDNGGGICGSSIWAVHIVGNVILGNLARGGGGIWSTGTIVGNTVVGNSASNGGGVYQPKPVGVFMNNVLAFNSSGLYSATLTAGASNCIYGSGARDYNWYPTGTVDNISADPRFVARPSPGPDWRWGTADDDYGDVRLQISSPCIDAGDNTAVPEGVLTDFGGRPRFVDATGTPDTGVGSPPIVDMGAYEYQATGAADFNDDGLVDMTDLATFLACGTGPAVAYDPAGLPVLGGCTLWPGAGDLIPADFDGDGDVDQEDFGVLQRCYSGTEPADPGCGG